MKRKELLIKMNMGCSHLKNKMLQYHYEVNVGLRLFGASIALALFGEYGILPAVLSLFLPSAWFNKTKLAIGPELTKEEKEKQDALIEQITKKVNEMIDKSNTASKTEMDKTVAELNKMVKKLSDEGMEALDKRLKAVSESNEQLQKQLKDADATINAQGVAIKALQESGAAQPKKAKKTFREALEDGLMKHKDRILKEVNDDYGKRYSLKRFFEDNKRGATPDIIIDLPVENIRSKAPVDMFESNIVGTGVADMRLTEMDPQRVGIPLTIYPHVMDVMSVKTINRPYMALLVAYNYENGAATKAEGVASQKSSFLFKTVLFKAFYIATHFVLSDETLDDLDEVMDEIAVVGPDMLHDAIDAKILGSSGDDVTDIAGILTANKHTVVNPALLDEAIDDAYIVDVIALAKLQIELAKYRPNVVHMSPVDEVKLAAAKDTTENSVIDRRVSFDNLGQPTGVLGLRLIKSAAITANQLIVYDNKQTWIGRRRDVTMIIGYNGTDLVEGQQTVVLKVRIAFGVRDKAGVVYVSNIDNIAAQISTT